MSIPIMTQCHKVMEKFYELEMTETELAALAGLWIFAIRTSVTLSFDHYWLYETIRRSSPKERTLRGVALFC